ncbi:tellurite resistance TerB family protein [Fulvivirga lutea]|uniref:Co-chaperone DjlA N-terminal domain-containing protein n=1 Tax=Fulvivirga lutea TaxID=2810512 RepID=A0A974WHX9_9BACT|nr:hypothetical protein [Fulvivirga lutea]QSE98878.1 hypothetical protein JR347_07295 [Fulvivirga lutea]
MDSTNHLKNLVVLAYSDGVFEESELHNLRNAAKELGVPIEQLDKWIADADNIVLTLPEDNAEREKQLISMIKMSTADGYFSQDEYDLCLRIAEKLGYDGLGQALNFCMNESNLKNLIALASADGKIDDSEMAVIEEAAENAGVDKARLAEMLAMGSEFVHVIPELEEDRETQLIQMLSLAIADGEFTADEYQLCKTVAERLGFTQTELDMIIKLSFQGKIELDGIREVDE